jgi:hypothetical protein
MNQMLPAGFNMGLVLRTARNSERGLGTGGHLCVDSSYNVYFIYLPCTKTARVTALVLLLIRVL